MSAPTPEDRAYSMLAAEGVPRERARSVANGIAVLATRYRKEIVALEAALAAEREAVGKLVEAGREVMFDLLTWVPRCTARDKAHAWIKQAAALAALGRREENGNGCD